MIECPVCSKGMKVRFRHVERPSLLKCPRCGFERVEIMPAEEDVGKLYNEAYFASYGDERSAERQKRLFFERLLRQSGVRKGGKILEVGCGKGILLELAMEMGYDAYGVDISDVAIEACKRSLEDKRLLACSFDEYPVETVFDAVFMVDYIEHVADPLRSLRIAGRVLGPSGILVINTPMISSLSNVILGRRWPHYNPEHLCFFTKKAMGLALEGSGFRVLFMRSFPKMMSLHYLKSQAESKSMPYQWVFMVLTWLLPRSLQHVPFKMYTGDMLAVASKVERNDFSVQDKT